MLHPPRGYLTLAWLGLVANGLAIPLTLAGILLEDTWRTAHIAVGASAVLPTAVVGIVASVALLKGLIEAQMWLDKPENKDEAAQILSTRKWFNVPVAVLQESLKGQYKLGASGTPSNDPKIGPLYWSSDRGVISYPYKSLTLWFLLESLRWKFYPGTVDTIEQAKAINDKVTREDLWREAAKAVGVPEKDIPTSSSRGKEVFFDGIVYDPANPQAYLNSLKIKN